MNEPNGSQDASDVAEIAESGKRMIAIWDHWMSGRAGAPEEAFQRMSRAACFAAAAYDAHPFQDSAPGSLVRAFLIALADPMDPQLDCFRACNQPAQPGGAS